MSLGGFFITMTRSALMAMAVIAATVPAMADFSYTTTRKTTGGSMAAMAGNAANGTSKTYFKGQKMRSDTGDISVIMDFDAQTITTINNAQKTVSVQNFKDIAAAQGNLSAKIDVKETGQTKTVNGFKASELVMTMDVESPQTAPMGKMQMEMDMWLSKDVPGAGEARKFYQKNMASIPWAALSGGGNQGMQAGMADLQRKIAEMDGISVEQVVKIKMAGGAGAPAMPQMSAQQSAQMAEAMKKLQELQKQGGPAAAAAAQAMGRMGAMQNATAGGGGSNSMMEMTMDSADFSTSAIPDSVFAIPAGYSKK
jgi:hypothetical protein